MRRGGVSSVLGLLSLVFACSSSGGDDRPNPGTAGQAQGGAPQAGAPSAGLGGAPAGAPGVGGAPTAGAAPQAGATPGGSAGTGGATGGTAGTAGAPSGGTAGDATGGTAGTGGTSAGTGGGGGSPAVELKTPIERAGKYTLEFGDVVFTVDPAVGARVTTFSLKGKNLLTDAAADMSAPEKNNWGSTFWPSPQSAESWGGMDWPPIPEIDSMPYTTTVEGTTIVAKSGVSTRGKMSLVKRFAPVLDAQAVDLTFELKNENATTMNWAPWQITRVALNGLTFFPTGTKVVNITNGLPTSRIMNMGGISWYKNQSGDEGKYSADGMEGWMAQVSGDLLFVKKFPDVPAAMLAPNEGDSEIFAGKGYVEVEVQGAYGPVAAGASLTWTVRWYVRQLPDPSIATVGNTALVTMVRDIVKE